MSPDEFEKRLRRQPLRQIPDEWRAEILRGAESCRVPLAARPFSLSTIHSKLSTLLWPHPKAWVGLAAVWMVLIIVNFASGDSAGSVEKKAEAPSPQTIVVFRQQQQMLAELIGPPPAHEADRPKRIFPSPRSERRREELLA